MIDYKPSGSYRINEKLYDNSILANKDRAFVNNLDSALKKMPNYKGDLTRDMYFVDNKAKVTCMELDNDTNENL